ncbi:hypothetical protein M408DRAFT_203761 [Serendipita vermifera MAFF 305830]|uniref:REM-1 domain-containing protein n=1 Tax=Serendipita vermifera MAFF 305830 TaxID=933852 RepID=A0A0C2WH93_SERVB|nr:hypothetical protein M408DRAFT_203761 [Serendipita vermifera MAFF 305830]
MPSHVDATTAATAHNIRGDRGIREKVENGTATNADLAKEWPELVGLEVPGQLKKLGEMLQVEMKIKDGAELMLEARTKQPLRRQVESQLEAARSNIQAIQKKMESLQAQSHQATRTPNATKRKPMGGLTFLNDTGLPAAPPAYSSNQYAAANGTSNGRTMVSNNGGDVSSASTLVDKRVVSPSPMSTARSRSKSDGDVSLKDDHRSALTQASSLVRALAVLARTERGRGDVSPPAEERGLYGTNGTNGTAAVISDVTDAELETARLELMTNLVHIFAKNQRVCWEIQVRELIAGIIPSLGDATQLLVRIAAYRLLRYVMSHPEGPELFSDFDGKDLGWFVVRSLSRDNKHIAEKEQVLLLVRALIDVGSERRSPSACAGCSTVPLRENIVRALVSLAEHEEDTNVLRWPAVEMLAEILLLDAELLFRCEGIRVLLQTLADGPPELGTVLANAFLTIVDNPRTRSFLHLGTDLEMGMSGLTDSYGRGEAHAEAMKASARIVITLLRSWTGLMYLCTNDMLAIRSLVNTLRIPNMDTREIILDMFFEVLNIKPVEWYRAFLDGRRLTMYGRQKAMHSDAPERIEANTEHDRLTLVDQYLSLVLAVLTEAGLLDALVCMAEELPASGSTLARKATLLLGEVLQASNRLLPLTHAARIQALPKLFGLASDYNRGQNRMIGNSTLSSIDSFNRNRSRLQPAPTKDSRNRANSVDDPMRRGQRQIEQVKIKMALSLDDKTFQLMLSDTQVVQSRDHNKWNYEILVDLFEGPFLASRRIEEGFRNSKFGRRLMSFWHPSARRFSELRKTKANQKWVKLGCLILSTLVKTQDGSRFLLNEDDFLKDLSECFAHFDPWNGNPAYDSIFTKQRVEDTLSFGYLQMLGQLSKTPRGLELMESFKFFNSFYHLSDLKFREDLIKGIVENLDYTVDGHSRIILSKALTSSYAHVRLYSTKHLGDLILSSKHANIWTLRLLLTQLYDPAPEVREMAIEFLEHACKSRETLKVVVDMQPTLDHLGELGHPLLLRFMSTTAGFRYLYQTEYIERGMNAWFHERNLHYVVSVEVYLAKAFSVDPAEEDEESEQFDGIAPPHFYGEMVKTELGCQVLHDKGHFSDFTHFIRQHGYDSDDSDIILRLKSVLWAVGNIGATEKGIPFLEEEDIIPHIVDMASSSPVLSVRGTCFFVIGLIASTEQGAEILSDCGWLAATTALGEPTGMCIPEEVSKFMALPPWDTPNLLDSDRRLPPLKSQHERDILEAIENLCNTVVANAASRTLAKLKSRTDTRHLFSSGLLLQRALHIISTRRYRFPVRRYILELFDVKFSGAVLEEVAHHQRQAMEDLRLGGAGILSLKHVHSHGHNNGSHGSRRSRHSMRGKARRRSNAEFRNGGTDNDGNQWHGSGVPDSPVIVRPKADIQKVTGFDAIQDDTATPIILQAL